MTTFSVESRTFNKMISERKHLTEQEVERILAATKTSRNSERDYCLVFLMFRHGLRVSEACGLRLSDVNIESRQIWVGRLKKGLSTNHSLPADEITVIKRWLKVRSSWNVTSDSFFVSEQRRQLGRHAIWCMLRSYGKKAELLIEVMRWRIKVLTQE